MEAFHAARRLQRPLHWHAYTAGHSLHRTTKCTVLAASLGLTGSHTHTHVTPATYFKPIEAASTPLCHLHMNTIPDGEKNKKQRTNDRPGRPAFGHRRPSLSRCPRKRSELLLRLRLRLLRRFLRPLSSLCRSRDLLRPPPPPLSPRSRPLSLALPPLSLPAARGAWRGRRFRYSSCVTDDNRDERDEIGGDVGGREGLVCQRLRQVRLPAPSGPRVRRTAEHKTYRIYNRHQKPPLSFGATKL